MSESEMDACDKAANAKVSTWESLAAAYHEKSELLHAAREVLASGYARLRQEREKCLKENGGGDISDADLIEINAGGKIVAATRGALTRLKGTGLEVLFGGRWENKILRDELGRVFLDVNPKALRSIVDYLHEVSISSPGSDVSPPLIDEDNRIFLDRLMSLFGLHNGSASQRNVMFGAPQDGTLSSSKEAWEELTFSEFPVDLKKAFQREQAQLRRTKLNLKEEQQALQHEKEFMKNFLKVNKNVDDIVHLNVSGVRISVRRSTLGMCEDSVLAKQFNDPKWRDSGGKNRPASVQDWDADEVTEWAKGLAGVPDDVHVALATEAVTGVELLVMGRQDFRELGITRPGTLALLMNGVNDLRSNQVKSDEVLISHSPYCFGKILDQLRLRRLCRPNDPPPPPLHIRAEEEMRFKKVFEYYFPGEDTSSFVLSGYEFVDGIAGTSKSASPNAGGFSFGRAATRPVKRGISPATAPVASSGGFTFGAQPPASSGAFTPSDHQPLRLGKHCELATELFPRLL